jgi:hypothetical protein
MVNSRFYAVPFFNIRMMEKNVSHRIEISEFDFSM